MLLINTENLYIIINPFDFCYGKWNDLNNECEEDQKQKIPYL